MLRSSFPNAMSLLATLLLSSLGVAMVGCNEAAPAASDAAKEFMLGSEPESAQTPTEIKEALAEEPSAVTLVGRVNAGEMEPFFSGRASFMVSQMPDSSHDEDDPDHVDNCPYCKRKLENAPRVIVEFKDDAGKVLELDSRSLFGIDKGSVVVIKGIASFNEKLNTLELDAKSIFVRS